MESILKFLGIVAVLFLLINCERLSKMTMSIDVACYNRFGHSIFSKPPHVSIKEVHLDEGILIGKSLIVKGQISKIDEQDTFLVISEGTFSMMIFVTNIEKSRLAKLHVNDAVQLLGTFERGPKNHPYISAQAINAM